MQPSWLNNSGIVLLCVLTLGCSESGSGGFPEDQSLDGPFDLDKEWTRIEFRPPLKVNEDGLQSLHLLVSGSRFRANSEFDLSDHRNQANLRIDGELVRFEGRLLDQNGDITSIVPVSNLYPEGGGITVGLTTFSGQYDPWPGFPEGVEAFTAVELRSSQPVVISEMLWRVDNHWEFHACGGVRCSWWQRLVHNFAE